MKGGNEMRKRKTRRSCERSGEEDEDEEAGGEKRKVRRECRGGGSVGEASLLDGCLVFTCGVDKGGVTHQDRAHL